MLAVLLLVVHGTVAAQGVSVAGRVDNAGNSLSGAAVYLEPLDDLIAATPRVVEINQAHLRFVPNVVVVSPGTEIRFLNSDPLMHNVFGPGIRGGDVFDLGTYPAGRFSTWRFDAEGIHVVLCHIHPEMVAHVIVTEAPYHAITASDGAFQLDGVRPGRYRINVWHRRNSREVISTEVVISESGVDELRITLDGAVARVRGGQ
jgi:plastocyanin